MFGKIIIPTVLAMLFIFQGSGVCAAEYALSPALDVIAKDIGLVKSTVITKELKFDRKDFEETFGIPLETITVTSLPDRECGVLKYAGSDVRKGLEIPAANIKLLKFTPSRSVGGAQFEVCADGNERLCATCRVSVLSGRNYAPYGGDMKVSALAGIGVVKALDAYDPDGDGISAEITEYPEKGIVKLCGILIDLAVLLLLMICLGEFTQECHVDVVAVAEHAVCRNCTHDKSTLAVCQDVVYLFWCHCNAKFLGKASVLLVC